MAPGPVISALTKIYPDLVIVIFCILPWNQWSLEALMTLRLRSRTPNCLDGKSSCLPWHFLGASMAN